MGGDVPLVLCEEFFVCLLFELLFLELSSVNSPSHVPNQHQTREIILIKVELKGKKKKALLCTL